MDITATGSLGATQTGDPRASALAGMADAQNKLAAASEKLATSPATPEVVLDVSQAEVQFAASAKVLDASQENTKRLLDIVS